MIVPGTKSLNACQVYFITFENLGPVSPNLNENLLLVVPTGAAAEKFLKFLILFCYTYSDFNVYDASMQPAVRFNFFYKFYILFLQSIVILFIDLTS